MSLRGYMGLSFLSASHFGIAFSFILAVGLLSGPFGSSVHAEADDAFPTRKDYVLGNTLMTMYHEFGHTLVTELDLPVLGREEDAVDNFSVVTIAQKIGDIDAYGDELAEQLETYLWAAGDAWLSYADADEEDEMAYAGEHSLDLQRFYAHVCLVYGSDTNLHEDLVDSFDVEDEFLEDCETRYEDSYYSWNELLSSFVEETAGEMGEIEIVLEEPGEAKHATYVTWLEDWLWLQDFEESMSALFPLPDPIALVFTSCGEANAYWDPEEQQITFCYELMETYSDFHATLED